MGSGIESEINALAQELSSSEPDDSSDDSVNDDVAIGDSVDDDVLDDSSEATDQTEESTGGPDEEISTIAQLSEAIGWDTSDLYSMKVGMGDNQEAIPLGQLKDSYQTTLKEKQALETQLAEQKVLIDGAQSGFQQQQQVSQEMQAAQANLAAIQQQYAGYNWQEAEADDPGQAALMRQKFQEAFNNAQGNIGNIETQQKQYRTQQLQQASVKLHQLIPEWSDNEKMRTGQLAVKELLSGAGYDDSMIGAITDPIAVSLMNELVQLRKEKKGANEAIKKARVSPKVLKAGGKRVSKQNNADALAKKAISSGDKNDEIAAIRALLT